MTFTFKKEMSWNLNIYGTSLVVQWLSIHLPMQGTQVRSLIWEDSTCPGAIKPLCHSDWACPLEPVLCHKRRHCKEKPTQWEACSSTFLLAAKRESACCLNEDPVQPKIKLYVKNLKNTLWCVYMYVYIRVSFSQNKEYNMCILSDELKWQCHCEKLEIYVWKTFMGLKK